MYEGKGFGKHINGVVYIFVSIALIVGGLIGALLYWMLS